MALVRVVIPILLGLILLGNHAAAQRNERVHGLTEKALAVIRESNDEEFQARLLSDAALLMARNHEEEAAHELFDEALEKIPEDDSYNQLSRIAENQAYAGLYVEALRSADVIRGDKDDQYGDDEADLCFSSISRAMARRADVDLARTTCRKIQQELWRSYALAELAVANFKRGDTETAQSLVDDATKTANTIADNQRLLAVEFMVGIFVRGGMQECAHKLVADEVLRAMSAHDWGRVRSMEVECANVDGVRRANREVKKRSDSPLVDEFSLMAVAEAQAKSGLGDDARETAKSLVEYQHYELTAGHVAEAFIKAGRLNDALDMIETINQSERKRDAMTYGRTLLDLAAAYFEKGDVEKAKELLNKSRQHVQAMELALYRSDFATVGEAHGVLSFDAEYEAWANSLESPYAKATALIGLAIGILDREQKSK